MNGGTAAERIDTDFIVIGGGVAGLRAAVDLARAGRVLVLTKTQLTESNSRYAQGGIAAAIGASDSTELHVSDTLAAGAGLCDKEAVRILAKEAPSEIERLMAWGTDFDRVDGDVALGREGAHSRARVLHAQGDATGKEIIRALSSMVRSLPSVRVMPFTFVQQLLIADGRVVGVRMSDANRTYDAFGAATLIASGGAGQVYRETTNPAVATGDGFALGYRAGAVLRDMEFVQFHPTALRLAGRPPFLISEAVRGEGAHLIDSEGRRFVDELAPRDIVARSIYERVSAGSSVYLDLRCLPADRSRHRFPLIYSFCLDHGLDMTREPLPVIPAAHYFMGGLYTDLEGRTSLPGLFAAGEAASTGVHGANRLASNSLLECVVFGKRAASVMIQEPGGHSESAAPPGSPRTPEQSEVALSQNRIRDAAWLHAGIVRNDEGLHHGLAALNMIEEGWRSVSAPSIEQLETANLLAVARLILESAVVRRESRGAHYRTDHSERNDAEFGFHSWATPGRPIVIGKTGH